MSKIAIIDLFFYWPPGGGSHVDVKEIAQRLARTHEVRIFLPNIRFGVPFKHVNIDFILKKTKFFNRGKIFSSLPLSFQTLDFHACNFTPGGITKKFAGEINKFNPDYIYFAQGSFLKPSLINALKEYKIISRYYSHEAFCIKGDGQYFRKGKICKVDPLDGKFSSYLNCLLCSSGFLATYPSPLFIHEYMLSRAFMPSQTKKQIEAIRSCKAILTYNNIIGNSLKRFNKNTFTIPGGVNTEQFGNQTRQKPTKIKNILMLGRSDDPTKGFPTLFKTGKNLWKKRKDFNILVSVRDSMKSKYKAEFIKNLGWIPFNEIPDVYSNADIVVVPSVWAEPFGIVAAEAMASRKPVIVSKVGGLQDIVDDSINGFIFHPSNHIELEAKLTDLLDNPELCKKMGNEGRKKAELEYDWDKVFAKHYGTLFN